MFRGTTIVAVLGKNGGAMAGDGQVTMEQKTIVKQKAHKVRRIYENRVLVGFAGSVADAHTLSEKFEGKLKEFRGNLPRAAVELAKEWRTDRVLRKLEALLLVLDAEHLLLISGQGEVIEPDDRMAAIGSGGPYALAAARALRTHTSMNPREVAEEAVRIASSICVFTNDNLVVEDIGSQEE